MDDAKNCLSDKKLEKFMDELDIRKIADLFSNGQFNEIIFTYFTQKKVQKKETINIQTIQQFFNDEMHNINNTNNNKDNNINNDNTYNDKLSQSNKNLNLVKNNENLNLNNKEEEHKLEKTLSFQASSYNSADYEYILNTPPDTNNNLVNIFNEGNSDNSLNNKMKHLSNDIIDDYYSSTTDEKEYNYSLLEKCESDTLTQQILLTIVIYCLIKIKEYKELKSLFIKYNIPNNKCIFPLILLAANYYFKNNIIGQCLDIYTEAINNYNSFKSKNINSNDNNNNDIIFIETYRQEFVYFNNLFNYLFALNNIDSKIKKLYYQQKLCLYHLNFNSQGFKLLIELYNKYPNDVQIQFELAKDSIFLSKYDIFKEMFEILKKSMNEEKDENKKLTYTNYLLYVQGLSFLSLGKVEETRNSFTEILKNDSSNVVIINNNALLSPYKNKAKESLDILNLIESHNQMDCYNEAIHENIRILTHKFNADLQRPNLK